MRHGCSQGRPTPRGARFLATEFSPRTRRSLPTANERQSKPHWRNARGVSRVLEARQQFWELRTKLWNRRSSPSASISTASRCGLQRDLRISAERHLSLDLSGLSISTPRVPTRGVAILKRQDLLKV